MQTDSLSDTIKVRVQPEWRSKLQKQADAEHLELSDIVRRALREFICRMQRRKASHGTSK